MEEINTSKESAWQTCHYCSLEKFKSVQEFTRHLRERHCTKEGGSYVCRYGYNGVCNSLPLDGVSDRDYESHVNRHHISKMANVEHWTIYSAAQNLPAVLNDPGRGKQTNFFTKTWGDGFVERSEIPKSYYLPEITYSHFEGYLRKISRKYRRHRRISLNGSETPAEPIKVTSRISSSQLQHKENDINIIPEIFLKPILPLNDAGTFNAVFPCVGNESNGSSSEQQSGRLLQEKLSHYLDIVEVQIAEQVSQKSSAFFHAMTSHDVIMEQMSCATVEVKNLRSKVQQLDQNFARNPLKLLALARSRANHATLLAKLRLMATVLQTQPTLQLLLSAPDYVGALELIGGTQDVLTRELAGVTSLRHLPSQLEEMSRLIDKMLNTEFERYAAADLHRPLTIDSKVLDPDRLTSLVAGLLRQVNLHFLEVYKREAVTAAQAVLKQLLIENLAENEGDTELCLTGSGETTPTMSSIQWLKLLFQAIDALSKLVLRVKAVHDVIKKTTDASAGRLKNHEESDSFLSLEDHTRVEIKLHNLLTSVCDYCHERCASLITSQSEKNSSMTATQIIELSDKVDEFTKLCEEVSGKSSPALKVAFKSQAGRYIHKFHTQRKTKLSLLLDTERWRSAEVPSEFQALLEQLKNRKFCSDLSPMSTKETNVVNGASLSLLVGEETYVVVGTVLMLLRFICEYCTCAQQLPSMAIPVGKNLADLLQTFNSKTCQLVLGAGALQTAGLKTITSVNLALASRALQLVLWFLSHIKEHFNNLKVDVKKLGFDTVEENINHHIQQLKAKILSIMNSLVNTLLSDWTARPPIPSQSFRSISKQFVKLHEAVGDILPQEQVTDIYSVIHATFKERLREQILKMNIVNNGGPQHGVVTSELTFYLETLRTLKVLPEKELSEKSMEGIWSK